MLYRYRFLGTISGLIGLLSVLVLNSKCFYSIYLCFRFNFVFKWILSYFCVGNRFQNMRWWWTCNLRLNSCALSPLTAMQLWVLSYFTIESTFTPFWIGINLPECFRFEHSAVEEIHDQILRALTGNPVQLSPFIPKLCITLLFNHRIALFYSFSLRLIFLSTALFMRKEFFSPEMPSAVLH